MAEIIKVGVFFDGTGNNMVNDKKLGDGSESNIAKLYDNYNSEYKIYQEGIGTRILNDGEDGNENEIQQIQNNKDIDKEDYYDSNEMAFGYDSDTGENLLIKNAQNVMNQIDTIVADNPNAVVEVDSFPSFPSSSLGMHIDIK